MAASSSGDTSVGGMLAPGLACWALWMKSDSVSGLVGRSPEPIVWREATWVRSGPFVPTALVPRTVWHPAQEDRRNTSRPAVAAGLAGADAGLASLASHWSNSGCGWAST